MKILALSDQVVEAVHSPQIRESYSDVDLVIACGDLPYYYLEFVATMLSAPVAYVHGNHDKAAYMSDGRTISEPEGCVSLDDRVVTIAGVVLAGLGGSMLYNRQSAYQYSDDAMRWRIARLLPDLLVNRIRTGRYLDILVTHSPPFGIHDDKDLPHIGFKSFLNVMQFFRPKLLLHGHTHRYRQSVKSETQYQDTTVVNVYPLRVIQWLDDER